MAQYTVTAGCGHTATVKLYGPNKERQRRLQWMQSPSGKCNRCYYEYKRQQEAEQKAEKDRLLVDGIKQMYLSQRPSREEVATVIGRAKAHIAAGSPAGATVRQALQELGVWEEEEEEGVS
jgi:hypothetical protein